MTTIGDVARTKVFQSITLTDEVSVLFCLRSMKQSMEINYVDASDTGLVELKNFWSCSGHYKSNEAVSINS